MNTDRRFFFFSCKAAQRAIEAPGGAQSQARWGPGQPELVGGNQPTAGGWDWVDFEALCNPNHSVILQFYHINIW